MAESQEELTERIAREHLARQLEREGLGAPALHPVDQMIKALEDFRVWLLQNQGRLKK